ncbi:MAG TPA: Flp family type IVb pilin [Geminicoccaceae bacterium]
MRQLGNENVGPRSPLNVDERGTTAIEYALLAAVAAITAIGGLQAFGGETGALWGVVDGANQAIAAVLGR